MPPLKDVTTMVTAARSRSIRFTFIIQNFAQLKSVYGNEDAETIKGNCGNLVYLISTELAALEEISKMCGEVKSNDKEKTASTPLVTVTDLQKLKLFEAIIIRWRLSPFKTKYTPNFKMEWGHPKTEAVYPTREKKEIQKFDIKEFTKKKKSEKIKNSLSENSGSVSGGNPFKDNPFGPSNDMFPPTSSNPFGPPIPDNKSDSGLFGGLGGGLDLDAMMRDIDRKIAELDAEEARQKEEQAKLKETEQNKKPTMDIDKFNDDLDNMILSNNETKIKDVEPVSEKVDNHLDNLKTPDLDSFNIFNSSSSSSDGSGITIGNEKANIAVATSSPVEDIDSYDTLPKVENASIIQPNYNSGTVVKTEKDDYNIYNQVPDIMSSVKDEVKNEEEVKKEVNEFTSNTNIKPNVTSYKVGEKKNNTNDYNIYNTKVEPTKEANNTKINVNKPAESEKVNVNIDPDKVVINDNSVISDDEFFDDFFGDD